jgi:heparan-alpha-glucosaminide N-acetyltransferase
MATDVRSAKPARLACLDAFRGLDILVMIFVNYVAGMRLSPAWLQHAADGVDGYTITDVVFPGFLFIVGVAIPLALHKRMMSGESPWKLAKHVLSRTFALFFLGVLTVNERSYDAAATGMSRALWYFLAFVAVIVFWNIYPKTEDAKKRRLYLGMRLAAAALLLVLVVLFRETTQAGAITAIQTSWWGILGLIGWSYMGCSFVYLVTRGDRTALMGAMGFMIALYIGARHGALDFLGPAVNGFVRLDSVFGSHSAIVTAGMLAGTLFVPGRDIPEPGRRMKFMAYLGLGTLVAGYVLRPLHGISKNQATDSYALVTSGLCCLVLLGCYFLMDVKGIKKWTNFILPIGVNPLLAYIMPDIVHSLSELISSVIRWDVGKLLWPFRAAGGWPGHVNAIVMTLVILLIVRVMTKAKVVLKL